MILQILAKDINDIKCYSLKNFLFKITCFLIILLLVFTLLIECSKNLWKMNILTIALVKFPIVHINYILMFRWSLMLFHPFVRNHLRYFRCIFLLWTRRIFVVVIFEWWRNLFFLHWNRYNIHEMHHR